MKTHPSIRSIAVALLAVLALAAGSLHAATKRTRNFVVHAPTAEIAEQVGEAAEIYRRELALEWMGTEFKPWGQPCPITVTVGTMGAGGATTFTFDRGEVFNWNMRIQGSLERILDSVLPHEISHTIFATHFRRPLPRWADEGAATLVEHESERRRQSLLAQQLINERTKIPLKSLLTIKEYPQEMQKVLMLYAEGYTLANFLVDRGGKAKFIAFLDEAHRAGWERALAHNYKYDSVSSLEKEWCTWVMAGEPSSVTPESLAQNDDAPQKDDVVIRSQTPDDDNTDRADPKPRTIEPGRDTQPSPRKRRETVSREPDQRDVFSSTEPSRRARRSKQALELPVITRPLEATHAARPDSDASHTGNNRLSRDRLTTQLPRPMQKY